MPHERDTLAVGVQSEPENRGGDVAERVTVVGVHVESTDLRLPGC